MLIDALERAELDLAHAAELLEDAANASFLDAVIYGLEREPHIAQQRGGAIPGRVRIPSFFQLQTLSLFQKEKYN